MKLDIIGHEWKVKFWKSDNYEEKVCSASKATTDCEDQTLDFDAAHLSLRIIRHELTHAYAHCMSFIELQLRKEQMEEFFCELVGKYGDRIAKQAEEIMQAAQTSDLL